MACIRGHNRILEHLDYWEHLVNWMNQRQDLAFFLRYHPRYDYPQFFYDLSLRCPNLVVLDAALSFAYLQDLTDVCLMVNEFFDCDV